MPAELLPTVVPELSSAKLTAVLRDEDGQPIQLAALTTLTMTLYLRKDQRRIVNSRNATDVKNANGGTFAATSGAFTFLFASADMALVDEKDPGRFEDHIALFEWTWNGGLRAGSHEYRIRVEPRAHV